MSEQDRGAASVGRASRRYADQALSQHRATSVGENGGDNSNEHSSSAAGGVRHHSSDAQEFRIDLERVRFSSYFARLSDVTQVIPRSGVGPVMHNRLTHSLKVSAVARVIASNLVELEARHRAFVRGERVEDDAAGATIARLGGCDTIVVQAAGHAHDLGHPPFGHLGERVLDRVARGRLGLPEGFEGNAQSFRILTQLDTLGRDFPGLNLTAAVRAATLKYPWTRTEWIGISLSDLPVAERPRGSVTMSPVVPRSSRLMRSMLLRWTRRDPRTRTLVAVNKRSSVPSWILLMTSRTRCMTLTILPVPGCCNRLRWPENFAHGSRRPMRWLPLTSVSWALDGVHPDTRSKLYGGGYF
ncbi:HD domain-containing protein [Leucobacter coleopterorum]|uniref:HD domain-containing protein n=1 Tax=Leucobacter coleopterorum TaxID=2714933 RepID=UPI001FCA4E07|nr:HD domain-containing protein [Leucobacter coleopterorum]